MNTEQELRPLPCPFCGGDAIVVGHGPYRVACMKCTASLPHLYVVTEAEAIAAWNRRAPAVAAGGVTEERVEAACAGFEHGVTQQTQDYQFKQLGDGWLFRSGDWINVSDALRAALTAALAVGDEGIRPDLLAEMAKHPGWSIERGYRDRGDDEGGPYGWCVYDVRGGRSDLEWDLIGFGETPHEALSAAVASLPTPPSRGEGE